MDNECDCQVCRHIRGRKSSFNFILVAFMLGVMLGIAFELMRFVIVEV